MANANPLHFVLTHPMGRRHPVRALRNFLFWQCRSRLVPGVHEVPWVGNLSLLARRGDYGLTGNIYCGLHEFWEMSFLLHFLKPGDLFVDIGANLGSFTLLAAGLKGANTHAIEPIPATCRRLEDNIRANQLESLVTVHNVGLGEAVDTLVFTDLPDSSTNRVALPGESGVEVPVQPLDQLLVARAPDMIKLDVEGHEQAVLLGAGETLNRGVPVILMETLRAEAAERLLKEKGFQPFTYEPFSRSLEEGRGLQNTLYIQDPGACISKLQQSPPFALFGEAV